MIVSESRKLIRRHLLAEDSKLNSARINLSEYNSVSPWPVLRANSRNKSDHR